MDHAAGAEEDYMIWDVGPTAVSSGRTCYREEASVLAAARRHRRLQHTTLVPTILPSMYRD